MEIFDKKKIFKHKIQTELNNFDFSPTEGNSSKFKSKLNLLGEIQKKISRDKYQFIVEMQHDPSSLEYW